MASPNSINAATTTSVLAMSESGKGKGWCELVAIDNPPSESARASIAQPVISAKCGAESCQWVLKRPVGHARVAITLTIYGHVMPHMQQLVADTMDDIMKL
jgi:hypothetical protein